MAQVFSCEFCEISKNTIFYRTTPVDASQISIKCATQSLTSLDIQNIRIRANLKHTCKYRVSQDLIALDLYSVSVNKISPGI